MPVFADSRPHVVWVLVPTAETTGAELDYFSDYSQSQEEFERALRSIGMAWRWQPVTMRAPPA